MLRNHACVCMYVKLYLDTGTICKLRLSKKKLRLITKLFYMIAMWESDISATFLIICLELLTDTAFLGIWASYSIT